VIEHMPSDEPACAELLVKAARDRARVCFVGGGAALGVGNPGLGPDVLLDTRRLDRVVEYAPEDQVIVAEAGVTLARLAELAAQNSQCFGVDAPHAERATLGGLVSVGAFGPRRARYGGMRELLLGMTLVRADGAVAHAGSKVVKNVAGFDLAKVVCGALGTLGLVTRVTLRLHPSPEASETVLASNTSTVQVVEALRALRRAQLEPSSVVAQRRSAGFYDLGVRFEGFERGVRRDAERCAGLFPGVSTERADALAALDFWKRHESTRTEAELRLRVNVLPTQLPEIEALLEPLLGLLERPRFDWYTTLGIGFASGTPTSPAAAMEALTLARSGAVRLGGSLVLEAAPPSIRGNFDAFGPLPSAFAVMRELKQRFDPEGRLNPGRFVGGL
jgi:glycolate oxidase FAD binding subunit